MSAFVYKKLTFKNFLLNIEAIKSQYWDKIVSFSCLEQKKKLIFIKEFKQYIYSFKIEEWKCDKIYEYFFDDIDLELLKKIIGGMK